MAKPTFSAGLGWFKESLHALRRQPIALTGVVVFSLLVSGLLSSVPFLGMLLASLWMPYSTILTATAARDALAGRPPQYAALIAALRDQAARPALAGIGLLATVWVEADIFVFEMLGREELSQWKITAEGIDFASIYSHFPTSAAAAAFALYIPLLLLTAFSPLLVFYGRQRFGKSLFYSFFGTLRSLAPVLLFLVIVIAVFGAALAALELLFAAAGLEAAVAVLAPIVMAVATTVSQAGVWTMFRDIFGDVEADGPGPQAASRRS